MNARIRNQVRPIHVSSRPMSLRLSPVCHAIALMLAAGVTVNAHAGANLANVGAQISAARSAATGGGVNLGVGVSPQQALQASRPSIQNLAHAAQGIAQQIEQQALAAAGAGAASNVPNGLAAGGLQMAAGATSNSPLWLNANLPTQSVNANGQTNVNIQQTGADAILTWQTMNVGRQTTLNFDQSGGTQSNGANNWVVLNRIEDPSGRPSQILGNVTAQGSVYVINRNGIVFGAGSQINVHSLVASSLDLLNMNDDLTQTSADVQASDTAFLAQLGGLVGAPNALELGATEVLGLGNTVSVSSAAQYPMPGDITIEPGASITTHTNGSVSDGGFVLIAAPNVTNGGNISATNGQVILAAGVGVGMVSDTSNPQLLQPELTGQILLNGTTDITPAGTLTNTGIVQADKGYISLLGSNVNQNGVVGVTTGVSYPGGITISTVDEVFAASPCGNTSSCSGTGYVDSTGTELFTDAFKEPANRRAGLLSFAPGSITADLPEEDGETTTSDQNASFTPGSIALTAGSVWFQNGSLIEAPGANVTVAALSIGTVAPPGDTAVQGRIYLDTGATIDVSGLSNVELPIAEELLTIPLIGQNELANSPLLRDGFLDGLKNVVVDSTLSGTNADGSQWVGSPVLNLADYVSAMPRTVDQLLTNGGAITLSGAQVMTASGSSLNLNGGYIHYDGGIVNTTRLIDANGAIVPIGQASPFDTYVGIAGEFIESHPHWGVTRDWYNPLLTSGTYEPDFIVGGNAGTLNVFASQALVLDGDITAQAFSGSKQVQDNAQPGGGNFVLGAASALSSTVAGFDRFTGVPDNVILQSAAPQLDTLAPGFSATTPLDMAALNALGSDDPDNLAAWQTVPVDTLSAGGFANVSVTAVGRITVAAGSTLQVQPGGAITLTGVAAAPISVLGSLIAPAGTIAIATGGIESTSPDDIVVGPDALISAAGEWVNNDSRAGGTGDEEGSEFIDGGHISLSIGSDSTAQTGPSTDTTGSIILQPGSVLDVSSGGELQANGQLLMQDGIPEGNGGSVSLVTYAGHYGNVGNPGLPSTPPNGSTILMDGTIRSEGFAGGGTLTLQALGFQIGGDPASAPAGDLYLPADFFATQGFGQYVLNALYGVDIAPGTTVRVTQQNLIPDLQALQGAATGSDIETAGLTTPGTLDPYHRQATSLTLTGGAYLAQWTSTVSGSPLPQTYANLDGGVQLGEGASIVADAGASIGLASTTQVTVLGSITAPGGAITLSADTRNEGFDVAGQAVVGSGFTTPSQSVWLGSAALLDVAGVALTDPLAAPVHSGRGLFVPDTGKVLAGGTVVLSDNTGYVVALPGSVIDVSGTSANFDELQANGSYASEPVRSDAGSITIGAASGLYFNAALHAQGGAAQAQGGTLTILPEQTALTSTQPDGTSASTPGATALVIQQSGQLLPDAAAPGDNFGSGTPAGVLQFSADELNGSGITTLVLGSPLPGDAGYGAEPVPIVFAGDVNLTLNRAVVLNTDRIVALSTAQAAELLSVDPGTQQFNTIQSLLATQAQAAASASIGAPTVTINAPYVALAGPLYTSQPNPQAPLDVLADGTLNINASFIDLENQLALANFGQANFTSSGDIRLSSTNLVNTPFADGELFTSGNLTFKAADLYPSSGSTFILDAVGPVDASNSPIPTTITFLSNGPSGVPLSAGGSLLVDATNIVQAGTVRAPSGSLIFGVGNANDPATVTQFANLPLTNTQSVTLANGSLTSVSDDDSVIPYGTTVDGTEWQYNLPGSTGADVTAPPPKFISANGSDVSLNAGATIDLSGGGDLQAEEWVPGTGGTRDVLSQYNISYATNPTGTAVPTVPGGANVYAIVPGYHAPVSAFDPVFAQVTLPSTTASGAATTTTASIGVGQAGVSDKVGESVYLSGVPGLPAGYYTLLPAKYATVPGAFRVTVSNASGPMIPGTSKTLPDGTELVAGYMGNALDGSRGATPLLFDVQSGAVWQQYSQYTLTSANSFFPALAMSAGNVAPQLPMDAGHLVLAATAGLTLGSTLNAAPAPGGAPAEVDIASQDIQIVGNGETALPGYLQISADQLDALGAGSLLIGGTRTQTASGITIDAIANSVVVSNDAADPLSGPEVMLVTKVGSVSDDPNAVSGLRIDAGSVIMANGSYPAAKDQPITIGQANDSTGANGVSGDGAFLSVTNGGDAVVTRLDTTGTGLLTVGAGATLTGGQALTLDSSGNLTFDPSASLSGNIIAVDGSAITFTNQTGAAAAALPGFVAGPNQLAQLANAQEVILRSAGAMNFVGNVDVTFGNQVDLSAGVFSSDGGAVTINAPQISFTNELGAPVPTSVTGSGTLTVNAGEIDFGAGDKTVSGFDSAMLNATAGMVGQGTGTLDFGTVPVSLNAPVYLAGTNSDATVQTTGELDLNATAGTALGLAPLGGVLTFIGGTLNDNGATIKAPAGNVNLEATTGDLTVASGSLVSSAGVALPFFDTTVYAPAGAITLISSSGSVNVEAGSTLDFSGAQGGGAAGALALSAPDQTVQLAGTIKGAAAEGYAGGSFTLDTGGAVDLDSLAAELASSGVNNTIAVQTNTGNLVLSAGNTLTAHGVSLTANGGAGGQDTSNGAVEILGTIDASGVAGGEIDLYGKSEVDIEGTLLAVGSSATQRGGTVNIGTTGTFNGTVNSTYGYENIDPADAGTIKLGADMKIDVSGGTAGGLSGGTVNFRAPLLDDNTVNVSIAPVFDAGKGIFGSRATTLEAYAVWSTDDPMTAGASKHFDGIVDPAGWYNDTVVGAGQPEMVAGTWTDQSGIALPNPTTPDQLATYLANDFFTPAAGATNMDHQLFYGDQVTTNGDGTTSTTPGTLMSFIENFPLDSSVTARFANVQNFAVVPGIELDNPDPNINDGNISILSNWNLGAGSSPTDPAFRFNGQAPVITFRAENNVLVDASLTDGFFQIADPTQPGLQTTTVTVTITQPGYDSFQDSYHAFAYNKYYYLGSYTGSKYDPAPQYANASPRTQFGKYLSAPAAAGTVTGPTLEVQQYYALYLEYLNDVIGGGPDGAAIALAMSDGLINQAFGHAAAAGQPLFTGHAPNAAEQLANPDAWLLYAAQYNAYAQQLTAWIGSNSAGPSYQVVQFQPPPAVATAQIQSSTSTTTITSGTPAEMDNSPSPVSNSTHALPLLTASLVGGSSSSFRLVAGADLSSADPLALQASSTFNADDGSVVLDGHFAYTDANGKTLLAPTMIRTGTGAIDIAAANDVTLSDQIAPGVIYTAGAPSPGTPIGTDESIVTPLSGNPGEDYLATPAVNPDGGGDISIHAQNNVTGIEDVTDATGAINSQFWWQWMQLGNTVGSNGQIVQTSIDFGAFDQGVMSLGGNVSVTAGGTIKDLAVSLPTTWYLGSSASGTPTVNIVGGGNLNVTAGQDILSGDYFVSNGTGTLTAGGKIASDGDTSLGSLSTLLATQNGVLDVTARSGADIGGVFNPSYLDGLTEPTYQQQADSQAYSSTSAVNVMTTTGDIDLGTLGKTQVQGNSILALLGAVGTRQEGAAAILPATVDLTAFTGGIVISEPGRLYPSATGQLNLIADQSIVLSGGQNWGVTTDFGPIDADPATLPSPLQPVALQTEDPNAFLDPNSNGDVLHAASPLHANDLAPIRIYSLDGSIVDGALNASGQYQNLVTLDAGKPAQIYAGQDILNLAFQGQNLRDDDVTRIVAGNNIDDAPATSISFLGGVTPSLIIGGPGTFDIEAGGNIGPLTGQTTIAGATTGVDAVGNANNPFLPHESADVQVLFGIGKGVDDAAFIASYIDPAGSVAGVPSTTPALIAFMQQYDAGDGLDTGLAADKAAAEAAVGTLTAQQAWQQFQALPAYVQQIFAQQVLFNVLTDVGNDFNNTGSPFFQQYARGYQAINILFPASLGYTANDLTGGANGANQLASTGNLDIRSSTIQTQQGGNVSILGPGGQALIGSTSAPPEIVANGKVVAGPNTMGILTLEQGNVDIFVDQSVLLAQSRIFTEQGGDMTIWSSNGDINAGKGAKSVADVPPPEYVCDQNHYCTVDAKGEVTGAGIATLQTIPGAAVGNVNLLAPRGTVDAGDAGIRVSGNLNVAALHVVNVDNIQVQGKSTGIPVVAAVDTGALTAAGSAASAVTQMAQNIVRNNASGVQQRHWIISVQVEGFGDSSDDDDKNRKHGASDYHALSPVAVLGFGGVGRTQSTYLTREERGELGFQGGNGSVDVK